MRNKYAAHAASAALGGTLQRGVGAVAMTVVGAVFNNSPLPLVSAVVVCALVAVTVSFAALQVPAGAVSDEGVEMGV